MEICATILPHTPRIWMCKRRFMAGVSYLPVFKEVYKLILKIFYYTNHFPRKYKYTWA
jgi:hypothetical protein